VKNSRPVGNQPDDVVMMWYEVRFLSN